MDEQQEFSDEQLVSQAIQDAVMLVVDLGDDEREQLGVEGQTFEDAQIRTYEEAQIMTRDAGFVLTLQDGSEYQVTIVRSRYGRGN